MRDKNKSELATKSDLADGLTGLKTELKQDISALDKKIDSVEAGLNQKIDSVEAGLNQKIDSVEAGLNAKINNVYLEVIKLQSRVGNIEEKMSTKDDISRVLNAIDKFAATTENYIRKDLERGEMLMKQNDKLQNHEKRLTTLETK